MLIQNSSARKFFRNYNQGSARGDEAGEHEIDHGIESTQYEAKSPKEAWREYFDSKVPYNEDIKSI